MDRHYGEFQIVELPAFRAACWRSIGTEPENESQMALDRWFASRAFTGFIPRRFGFDVEVPPQQAAAGVRGYESWYTLPDSWPADGSITVVEFPGGKFAHLLITDPFTDAFAVIPEGWQRLVAWTTQNCREGAGQQCLEEIIETASGPALGLYLPVG
ncbi:MAG: GyrI-like domain-containing protein [Anaerolineaceae bacterium]|nr:GyrI-like domain-containing protein [Anaerolineaceae bacterium]